ncbi:MAG TPA: class I SAM-dependent methyltransferase [Gaiellaceae bacterium]|nr:class I SAM-dependent methyltransferase [Gaiellaceae bacterium]
MSSTSTAQAPGVLDRVDLLLLRAAKRRRERWRGDAGFYEVYFTEDDVDKYALDVRSLWRFQVMRTAFEHAIPSGVATVVDVGCGLGAARTHLPERASYVGIDVSEQALELARKLPGSGGDFRHGGFPRLPVDDESCDFAVCLEVLEHLPDDAQAVADLRRIVRPGGYLLVSVPSTYYWPEYRQLMGHLRHYTGTSLERLLAAHRFTVIERYRQFSTIWRLYHYAYVAGRAVEAVARNRWSFYDSTIYRRGARRLLALLEPPTATTANSTFVLARRQP